MIAYASKEGICLLEFEDRKNIERQLKSLQANCEMQLDESENIHINLLKEELELYFAEKLTTFSVALDIVGSSFQKQVWTQLLKIPYGSTYSYKGQAIAMNAEQSVRAIANANGANKIAILIPCHRVIGTNKTLTGYAGGLERKRYLLNLESKSKDLFDKPFLY